jgi:hypothetical protein
MQTILRPGLKSPNLILRFFIEKNNSIMATFHFAPSKYLPNIIAFEWPRLHYLGRFYSIRRRTITVITAMGATSR